VFSNHVVSFFELKHSNFVSLYIVQQNSSSIPVSNSASLYVVQQNSSFNSRIKLCVSICSSANTIWSIIMSVYLFLRDVWKKFICNI